MKVTNFLNKSAKRQANKKPKPGDTVNIRYRNTFHPFKVTVVRLNGMMTGNYMSRPRSEVNILENKIIVIDSWRKCANNTMGFYKNEDDAEDTLLPPDWFIVEGIRGRRIMNGKVQYLIKWLGYNESENTWQFTKLLRQDKLVRGEITYWLKHQRSYHKTNNPATITTTVITPLQVNKQETPNDDTDFDSSDDEQVIKHWKETKRCKM